MAARVSADPKMGIGPFCRKLNGPHVVETHDVVGVLVGEQDGVEPVDLGAQGLRAEIRRGVDQDVAPAVADQDGGPQAVVARIVRAAHIAMAADSRHTHTGAGAEHCDAQRVAQNGIYFFLLSSTAWI